MRVLDFISIYIRQAQVNKSKIDFVPIIKKLIEALETAHRDENPALFERVKTVISQIGKHTQSVNEDEKDKKILMTEVMARMLKQGDKKLHGAYVDIFILLTKSFMASENKKLHKFV